MLAYFTISVISLAEYPSKSLTNFVISELLKSLLIPFSVFSTIPRLQSLSGNPTYTNLLNRLKAAKSN